MKDATSSFEHDRKGRRTRLGKAIRDARGDRTQTEFAVLVDRPQSVVSNWETGLRAPSLEILATVDDRLGLRLGSLAEAAGYFRSLGEEPDDDDEVILTWDYHARADAAEALEAAEVLGLGVRLTIPDLLT